MDAGHSASVDRGGLKVLLAERRASSHSELSRRLTRLGHEVLARVTSVQGAVDYAALLTPDVVLLSPVLEDGTGIAAAMTLTRGQTGIAAVVLTTHPAAADPSARPNWGAVALVPADAEPEDLDAELRRAVDRARAAASLGQGGVTAALAAIESEVEDAVEEESVEANSASSARQDDVEAMIDGAYDVAPSKPSLTPSPANAADFDDLLGSVADAEAEEAATPSFEVGGDVVGAVGGSAAAKSDDDVVACAVETLTQRTGLSKADVMRLMQEEASDTSQTLADVARAMLGDEAESGREVASAA